MSMQLSSRVTGITGGGSDGWEVFYAASAREAKGEPVANLTIGEHDIRTDPSILQAMYAAALDGNTGYPPVPGTPQLRAAVAARVQARTGVSTGPANILITPGGQAALFAAHLGALDPGDTALFIDPHYTTYPGTIRSAGGVPKAVMARSEDGFLPQENTLREAAQGAKSLMINTPNNPTGVVYGRKTLEGIARVCTDAGLWLISDEVYDTQVWDGTHLSPRALPGLAERTLVVGSLSKSHAMTGSRLGWLIGPEHAISHFANLATHTTYGVPGFIQDAGRFALAQGDGLEASIAGPFKRRREIVLRALDGQQVVRATPPQGAMYVMLDIRATGMSGAEFAVRLLDEENIAVMPGESFGTSAAGHVRVAMTLPDEAFGQSVARLVAFAGKIAA
jgi:arginine:pyruvate transaminase